MSNPHPYKRRPFLHWAALLCFITGGVALGVWQAMVHPNTPLSSAWNPMKPLDVTDPVTNITHWKFQRALANDAMCLAALQTGAIAKSKPDHVENDQCGISPQVSLSEAGGARVKPVNTRCQTALRLAMWTQHSLNPLAKEIFGQSLSEITHFSSYSCREMRTSTGSTGRMSSHATADSIDISGFVLEDGTRLSLLNDWDGELKKSLFLRGANTTACTWFRLTLGPNYNRLHADHFHLQNTGFDLCR